MTELRKIRIAVVEDEIIIADHLCETLEGLGYEALEPAISYSEAI
jgi:CheY-like chemotaxis protein